MKIRLAIFLTAAISLSAAGCRSGSNANTNAGAAATPTPVTRTTETVRVDPAMVTRLQDAYKSKGFSDITVSQDPSTGQMVLRGSVPESRLAEAMQIANELTGKPPKNELSVK